MDFFINLINDQSPLHQHETYEIIVYVEGTGTFHSPEKEFPVAPGKIIIVPPGVMHGFTSEEKAKRIYIRGEFSHIFNITSPTAVLDNSESEGILLAKMLYNNRYSNHEYLTALSGTFAYFLTQKIKNENKISQIIEDIVNKISNNFYDCNFNISDLLKKSGYAEDYIRAQFKKFTGKTPNEFLAKVRISHACYLIDIYKNSLSLSEIAAKCGYTDYVYFSKKFKQIMGTSPQKYLSPNP